MTNPDEGASAAPRIRLVESDRMRVEFLIDDLIRQFNIEGVRPIVGGCNSCSAHEFTGRRDPMTEPTEASRATASLTRFAKLEDVSVTLDEAEHLMAEFRTQDLVRQLLPVDVQESNCGGCNGCMDCSM